MKLIAYILCLFTFMLSVVNALLLKFDPAIWFAIVTSLLLMIADKFKDVNVD